MHTKSNKSLSLLMTKFEFKQMMLLHTKEQQESLSPEDKDLFEKNHSSAYQKYLKSSPEQQGQIKTIDVAAHKRKYELFPPEKKARLMETITE
jgi:hypothetical protein